MKLTIIGTGYVGLVTGVCFAEMGNEVFCIDNNKDKIKQLKSGKIPIYEPGLEELLVKNLERLHFSCSLQEGLQQSLCIFIAVGTPPLEDGSADLSHVLEVAKEVGKQISDYKIIIMKSTVPVGTSLKVKDVIKQELKKRKVTCQFDIVSNPEFLKEGDAIEDFMHPDRVIVGTESAKARELMVKLYGPFFRQNPRIIFMDTNSAEITKYAANAMLATKISFINELANICERVGADVEMLRLGIGADKRIGYAFICPGIGYGGSCFPKDMKALIRLAKDNNYEPQLLRSVENVNKNQKELIFNKLKMYFADQGQKLKDKVIGIWGITFKPGTDDTREAPSLVIINKLLQAGARVKLHDPQALSQAKKIFRKTEKQVTFCEDPYEALEGANAMLLLTEWPLYKQPDFARIRTLLKAPVIFDGRNQYSATELRALGFKYYSIGRN